MSTTMWFAVYKPCEGFDLEDAAKHAVALTRCIAGVVVLANLSASSVILFSKEEKIPDVGQTGVVRKVDRGRFDMICAEKKCKEEDEEGELREGDVVSIRRIYTDDNVQSQELMAYSCIALQKAYFWSIDGLRSCEYYENKDTEGSLIVGIGVWENAQSAYASVDPRGPGSPGEAYWRDLGASKLKFDVCRVIFVGDNNTNTIVSVEQENLQEEDDD